MRAILPILRFSLGILIVAGATTTASAVIVSASKDTSIYSEGVESNGAGTGLFIGQTNGLFGTGDDNRRALIAFDIAGAGIVDPITVVSLTLTMERSRGATETVSLHRLTRDWGEGTVDAFGSGPGAGGRAGGAGAPAGAGDATWASAANGTTAWTTPGGDFNPTASASMTVNGGSNGQYVWSSPQLLADVIDMQANPGTNFGWIVIGNETSPQTAMRFGSSDGGTGQPFLDINPIPEPSTAMLVVLAGLGLTAFGRTRKRS